MGEKRESFLFSMWKKSAQSDVDGMRKSIALKLESEAIKGDSVENMPFSWKTSIYSQIEEAAKMEPDKEYLKQAVESFGNDFSKLNDVMNEKSEEEEKEEPEENVALNNNAMAIVTTEDNNMRAMLFIREPKEGGADITEKDIYSVLEEKGITTGIFKEKITELVKWRLYNRPYKIAMGRSALHGENGRIVDHFPRERKLEFAARSDGSFDFKDSNIICNIEKGTLICTQLPPSVQIDGVDIMGTALTGREGKPADFPKGDNTEIAGNQLIAAAQGNIFFRDRRFNVQNVFEVKGDVDASMGNIDFAGDVIVRGNVREGYLIKAKGSIVVMGVVEGASLISDGGITIQKGMNGMNKGIIRTQKGLTSKYLENCTAHVKGDVISESIIYCNINCDGEVRAEGKHGAVIGGNIVVRKDLVAKVIGSENNSPTNIVLGVSPDVMNERGRLQKELSNLVEQRKAIEVDMQYLAKLIKKGVPLNESKVAQVRKLKIQDPMNKMRTDQVQRRLFEIEEAFGEADNSYLSCINIYPGVKITIGSRVLNITQPNVNCKYMIVDGDIGFLARSASQR